jgi:hypothetical protein
VPQRVVQQTAEPVAPPAAVREARSVGTDPFSELFAQIERKRAKQARQPQPRQSGRVAAAETGRGVR